MVILLDNWVVNQASTNYDNPFIILRLASIRIADLVELVS